MLIKASALINKYSERMKKTMTTKKLLTLALSALMISATAVSVSAATLTDQNPGGQTEVTAHISGSDPHGTVSYKITIPDVVDFGELVQPAANEDSYKTVGYNVSLDEVTGLESGKQISVYVKDQNASIDDDQNFYITNKDNSNISFKYHVFNVPQSRLAEATSINSSTMTKTAGFYLGGFTAPDENVDGTLVINQVQLYGKTLADIAGDYSGYMVFYSAIEDINP